MTRTRPGAQKGKKPEAKKSKKPKPAPRSRQTASPQPEQGPRFPRFNYLPAEIQWKIFREVMSGDPQFHVLKVGRVDDVPSGTWRLSFSPMTKEKDKSGYRMYGALSTVNPSAAAAVRHELTLRKRNRFQRLPFTLLNAHINGATDLVVLDFPRSTTPAFGYFHDDHQILNWQERVFDSGSVAKQFENTEQVGICLTGKHYSCHDMMGNFRCADRDDEEHSSHSSNINAWLMCPKELAGLLKSFPKLREFYIILRPFHPGFAKQDEAETYLKNYFTWPERHHHTHIQPFTGVGMSYIPLLDELMPNSASNGKDANFTRGRFPSRSELREIRDTLASLHGYFRLDSSPHLRSEIQRAYARTYRLGRAERDALGFHVLLAVPRDKIRECGGEVAG
ncbi:uncharacterized protein B0H64DRAFT_434204 [Chaetomium fimeti]|uniref:Uncharacterized protein n=1 Tax=Chaetomium fimeti TaxID=1854472 RepID=A0AAE0HAL4_9PEZI|nr:hypothetical protein B0H64DRAFT_434204 [Chaetomium fimeti]